MALSNSTRSEISSNFDDRQQPVQAIPYEWERSGVLVMDKLHGDLLNALEVLSSSTDKEFGARYGSFVDMVEHSFREEEEWMEDIDFPVLHMHLEQHARVLSALHNVHFRVMNGEFQLGHEVVEQLLPQWLAHHIATMDIPLAVAIQSKPRQRAEAP
jgi:hemerythrin